MTPIDLAAAVYGREPCARSFSEDVEAHFANGYVISAPDLFCLARIVRRNADPSFIRDPWFRFDSGDTWMVYLFAGDLSKLFGHCPEPKKWVAFERKNVLRFYGFESIRKKLCNIQNLEGRISTHL